ncbi:hypothetical protein BDN70DRAFT_879040 [Pholiota conissans]|uniref:Uncharacterized protein n=1 Tax=Pholiota conissans TaxID=109636 RepID=A0A9P5Z123_9AGAR|nr:hypothetical protein BDN70DRAFT_879040 [Pholiota conissans]
MALSPDIAIAVSVWVEAVLYGIYACLFFEAFYIMLKKQSSGMMSAKVFLGGTFAMFLVATGDLVVNLYRFLRGFVQHIDPLGPESYFFDFTRWDNLAHNAMLCIMTWLGDALVIYRCYVIWGRKLWVTVIPIILLLLSISSNAALFFWYTHPGVESPSGIAHWLGTVYPFAFAQNTITTGMIAFKIWRQHRRSRDSGVVNVSHLNLLAIMRIIIESAMIYTLQLLILIVLFPLEEFGQLIIQNTVIPSIGIIFVLIAVRVHFSNSRTIFGPSGLPSIHPWFSEIPDIATGEDNNTQDEQNTNSDGSVVLEILPTDSMREKVEVRLKLPPTQSSVRPRGQTASAP